MEAWEKHGVKNLMLLVEFYSKFIDEFGIGTPSEWQKLGHDLAVHLGPGGTLAKQRGISDPSFGVRLFTAFNEPDNNGDFGPNSTAGPQLYYDSLQGFATGVRMGCGEIGAQAACVVNPGGFMNAKAGGNYTMLGLCHGVANMWKAGLLNGIDMHTEFDVQFEPLFGTRDNSMQYRFDQMRSRCGLEDVPLQLFTTEFGFKVRNVTREYASRGLLTAIVDQWTVVNEAPGSCSDQVGQGVLSGASGNAICTSAVRMSMPWNLFHTVEEDPEFGMAVSDAPYQPSMKGEVFWRALNMTQPVAVSPLAVSGSLDGVGGEGEGTVGWADSQGRRIGGDTAARLLAEVGCTAVDLRPLTVGSQLTGVPAAPALQQQWVVNEPRRTNTHIYMPQAPGCARNESMDGQLIGRAGLPGDGLYAAQPCQFTIVWQALEAWTTVRPLTSFKIPGGRLPACTNKVEVHGWDGLRVTHQLPPAGSGKRAGGFVVPDLPGNETYFFRVTS